MPKANVCTCVFPYTQTWPDQLILCFLDFPSQTVTRWTDIKKLINSNL